LSDKEDDQSQKGYDFPVLINKEWIDNLNPPKNSTIKQIKTIDDIPIQYSLFNIETNDNFQESKSVDHRLVICHFNPIEYTSDRQWLMFFANICFEWLSFAIENISHKPLYEMMKKKVEYMKLVLHDGIQKLNSNKPKRVILTIDTYNQNHKNYPYFIHKMKILNQIAYVLVMENECVAFFQNVDEINDYLNHFIVRDLWRPNADKSGIKKPLNQQDIFIAQILNNDLKQIEIKPDPNTKDEYDSIISDTDNEDDFSELDDKSTLSDEISDLTDLGDESVMESEEEENEDENDGNDFETNGDSSIMMMNDSTVDYYDEEDDEVENTNQIIESVFNHYMEKKNKPKKSYINQTPDDLVRYAKKGEIDWSNDEDRNEMKKYLSSDPMQSKKSLMHPDKFKNILKNVQTNYQKDLGKEFSASTELFNHYIKTNQN